MVDSFAFFAPPQFYPTGSAPITLPTRFQDSASRMETQNPQASFDDPLCTSVPPQLQALFAFFLFSLAVIIPDLLPFRFCYAAFLVAE